MKIYIRDNSRKNKKESLGEHSKKSLMILAQTSLEVFIDTNNFGKLPIEYDGYILHLSELKVRELEQLREQNPRALVYVRTGHRLEDLDKSVTKLIDGELTCWDHEYEDFLKKLKSRSQT